MSFRKVQLQQSHKERSEIDVKLAIKYAVYLMEHSEELLIDTDNHMQQGQLPTFAFQSQHLILC